MAIRPALGVSLVLVGITAAALGRVCAGGFTSWDDTQNVVDNPHLNPPTLAGVAWHWRHPYKQMYVPLAYTGWAALAVIARADAGDPGLALLNPGIFHAANLAIHLVNVLLVFALLRLILRFAEGRTGGSPPQPATPWAAGAGALVFAIHPLQVEAVAWVSGFRDLLGGMFTLVALWAYLRFAAEDSPDSPPASAAEEGGGSRGKALYYSLATASLLLALLSKPSAVMTPVFALVFDRFVLRRPLRRSAVALGPWFAVVFIAAVVTRLAEPAVAARTAPIWARPFIAGDALAFYLHKLAFPAELAIDYVRRPARVMAHAGFYCAWLAPAAVAAAILAWRPGRRWLGAAGLFFLAATLPVSGLVPFQYQQISTVTDHYAYVALFGVSLAVAWALTARPSRVNFTLAAVVLAAWGARSAHQAGYWQSAERLFAHAVDVSPDSVGAHTDLGEALADRSAQEAADGAGDEARATMERAANEFRAVLALAPGHPAASFNYAWALVKLGREEEAQRCFDAAPPEQRGALMNRVRASALQGR